ncbi:MAG: spore coat protein [Clostridiales bacterium]|nr:spore coat protein [Clostridiales bacterium]
MNDQNIMENLLQTTKGACELYMHGTIESATQNVHNAFNGALRESLCMQDGIYQKMSQKGWYPMQQAEQQKITAVKNKFSTGMQ